MGNQSVSDMPNGNDGVSLRERDNQRAVEYELFQMEAKRLTTKRVPFVCENCYHTAEGRKSPKGYHYFRTKPCKPCNAAKSRHTRCNRYADMVYAYADSMDGTVWAITITLGNDVEKRVGHTTIQDLQKRMLNQMNEMRERSTDWKNWFVGGFQVFEHTIKDGKYHPHLHIVAISPKGRLPLKGKDKITLHSVLQKFGFGEYAYATKAYLRIEGKKVYATSRKAVYNAVRYIMKYAMKDTGGARKLSRFGCMRGYTAPLIDKQHLLIVDNDEIVLTEVPTEGMELRLPKRMW